MQSLYRHDALKRLYIGHNIHAHSARELILDVFNLIVNQQLEFLSVAGDAGYKGALQLLCEGLQSNRSLQELDLSDVGASDDEMVWIR